jgi:hypothetical protein
VYSRGFGGWGGLICAVGGFGAIVAVAIVAVAAAPAGGPALGQIVQVTTVSVNTPGSAFTVEGLGGGAVTIDDVPGGGRRFRGPGFSKIKLRALLRLAPARSASFKVERLAVHFRTSPSATGPTLRRVELWNGASADFRVDTRIQGDYMTKNLTRPDVVANVWSFAPRNVSGQTVLRLEVQFPGGFEGTNNPGEFVLAGVEADFPRKPAGEMTLPQR